MAENKVKQYAEELKGLIEQRTGEACKSWLIPQIEAAAKNRVMLEKMYDELVSDPLIIVAPGSKSQIKKEAHPLLPYFDKLQRTLLLQYEALGLNYKTTPAKVMADTKKEKAKPDPLAELLKDAKRMAAIPD